MPMTFYNELDPYPAAWLRNLIAAGHLPKGTVDERSIADLEPADLAGYRECHFFAGIGGWPLALRLADWPDLPVWTGSCPCQPFSSAGKRRGHADERHLWPAWFRLIRECRPPVIFGEQVASKAGLDWLDAVRADMEGEGYAVGAADLCAASVGAPHIRQRIWFVAHRHGAGPLLGQRNSEPQEPGREVPHGDDAARCGADGELADAAGGARRRAGRTGEAGDGRDAARVELAGLRPAGLMGHAERPAQERFGPLGIPVEPEQEAGRPGDATPWARCEFVQCADGKARPVEPGTFPLAHGVPSRVGRLRAYGNAIVPQVAAEFVRAFIESGA